MSLGGGEMMVLLIVVLLLFGPDKLPDLARQLGRGVREIRKMSSNLQDQFVALTEEPPAKTNTETPATQSQATESSTRSAEMRGETETDEMGANAWVAYAAAQEPTPNSHTEYRDEDDAASDWRTCEEEPPSPRANSVSAASISTNSTLSNSMPANSSPNFGTQNSEVPNAETSNFANVSAANASAANASAASASANESEDRLRATERSAPPRVIPRSAPPLRFQREGESRDDAGEISV